MLGVLGVTALLLALSGVYSAIAFNVARRTREIGVRIALGARVPTVVTMVLRKSLLLVGAGVAVGIVTALAASRVVSSLLYGISAQDPVAYAGAAAALIVAALFASWVPATRAARLNPVVALRSE